VGLCVHKQHPVDSCRQLPQDSARMISGMICFPYRRSLMLKCERKNIKCRSPP
jgi:hypothetical protein